MTGHLRISYDAQRGFVDEILETQAMSARLSHPSATLPGPSPFFATQT